MSSRNLKLVLRILEVMVNAEIPPNCSPEKAQEVFKGFDYGNVEDHFKLLCHHGCFMLKTNETWDKIAFGYQLLSWKGFDLLEQLQKAQEK